MSLVGLEFFVRFSDSFSPYDTEVNSVPHINFFSNKTSIAHKMLFTKI